MDRIEGLSYKNIVQEIDGLGWENLNPDEVVRAVWAYYFFSIQFRENMFTACELFPEDEALQRLKREECDTSNLSPFPDIADFEEKLDHDEFVRRVLALAPVSEEEYVSFQMKGERYLSAIRAQDALSRALSIASYEDNGLLVVFTAMLRMPGLDVYPMDGFRHFAEAHIGFDSDADQGHGALCKGIVVDDRVTPLWQAFKDLLIDFVPGLVVRVHEKAELMADG